MNNETYENFACKSVRKMTGSTTGYEQVQREIQIMKKLKHAHIVKLVEVLETPKKMYLVLEL
jgi:serine/threonine protein kinase